jgi:AmmeMemoRadiSam system protein B
MIREPVVAGQFYPRTPSSLEAQISKFIDKKASKEDVIGLVSPHAGYVYSGAVAGATISRIKLKDTFVIMGPNHTGSGKPFSIMTQGTWEMPLGKVEIDSQLGKKILEQSSNLEEDVVAHLYEHSIEVQIPFLQYLKPDIKIVPIVLTHAPKAVYKEIGRAIAEAIKESQTETIIIASSDMTHYESQESARKKDTQAINAMLKLDEDELLKRVDEMNISMCGYAPAATLIAAARELGAKRAELVKYQTSGDVTGDYSGVVGYAGILLMK